MESKLDQKTTLVGGVIASTVVAGWLVAQNADFGLYVLISIVLGIVIMMVPRAIFYIFVVSIFVDNVVILPGQISWTRLIGISIFVIWLGGKLIRRESFRRVLVTNMLLPTMAIIFIMILSGLWALYPTPLIPNISVTILMMLGFSLMMTDWMMKWDNFENLIGFATLGALMAAILSLSQLFDIFGFLETGSNSGFYTRIGNDVAGGINETAFQLTLMLPLAFYLSMNGKKRIWRVIGLLFIILGPVTIIYTFSRGSISLLPFVLLLSWIILTRQRARAVVYGVFALILLVPIIAGFFPWDAIEGRFRALAPISNTHVSDKGFPSRIDHWEGWLLAFLDYPILGTGIENTGIAFSKKYQFISAPNASQYYVSRRSSHSTVFGMLGDLGILGIGIWFWLNWSVFRGLLAARVKVRQPSQRTLVDLTLLCVLVSNVYAIIAVVIDLKVYWFVLGLAQALHVYFEKETEISWLHESGPSKSF